MKVKCTSSFYIVNKGIFDNGSIVEFDDELALKLIKQGVVVEYVEEVEAIAAHYGRGCYLRRSRSDRKRGK